MISIPGFLILIIFGIFSDISFFCSFSICFPLSFLVLKIDIFLNFFLALFNYNERVVEILFLISFKFILSSVLFSSIDKIKFFIKEFFY